MTHQELLTIALHEAKGTAPENYSTNQVKAAFVDGLRELAGSINDFNRNRYDIYDIIIKVAEEIVPMKVEAALGQFAEIQNVPQGQRAIFRRRLGKQRAKQFITKVGLSGVYETFRLDTDTFSVEANAIGGGVTIDFERMLDGTESLSEVMDILTEGLADAIYGEVHKALREAINATSRPAANKYSSTSFEADEMVKLMSVVRAYGPGLAIFAPPEFVAAMGPDAIVPVPASGNYGGVYHPGDIDAIHNTGYIKIFRGAPVIEIPQSFTDENNTTTQIDPQMAYILPTGGEKVVKVVFEGATQINDFKNRDNSLEVYAYKKMGVAIMAHHNWAIYQNTGIAQTFVG